MKKVHIFAPWRTTSSEPIKPYSPYYWMDKVLTLLEVSYTNKWEFIDNATGITPHLDYLLLIEPMHISNDLGYMYLSKVWLNILKKESPSTHLITLLNTTTIGNNIYDILQLPNSLDEHIKNSKAVKDLTPQIYNKLIYYEFFENYVSKVLAGHNNYAPMGWKPPPANELDGICKRLIEDLTVIQKYLPFCTDDIDNAIRLITEYATNPDITIKDEILILSSTICNKYLLKVNP